MAVDQSVLRAYASQSSLRKSTEIVETARLENKATAFLSHSHKDADLAKGVQGYLQAKGWEVYIDWQDLSMPDRPDRRTARRIQSRIRELEWFLYLATANSARSKWCPWEIGYADGEKDARSILVLQTRDQNGEYGMEYLNLYRHLDISREDVIGAFDPDNTGYNLRGRVLVESLPSV